MAMVDDPMPMMFGSLDPMDFEEPEEAPPEDPPQSRNEAMIQELVQNRSLRTEECIEAFRAIDRRHFWVDGYDDFIFADTPVRHGRLHISAPQIYGEALESLSPLCRGMSFLNVGSGTGYFNCVVSELIGELSTNHGVEIWPEVLEHATDRCKKINKHGIQFFIGNIYQLDIDESMRYDRIYIGACANSRSKYLYRLLEVGGVLVGPFQAGRTQQLRRVVRKTETEFAVEVLESVRFASLVEPSPVVPPQESASPAQPTSSPGANGSDGSAGYPATFLQGSSRSSISRRRSGWATPGSRDDGQQQVGLPGVPFTFALRERPWTLERCELYPVSYRRAVTTVTTSRQKNSISSCCLPREIWEQHIFPWCPRWWFEERRVSLHTLSSVYLAAAAAAEQAATLPALLGNRVEQTWAADLQPPPPPTEATSDGEPPIQLEPDEEGIQDLLFEVFGNGQRHVIGTEGDPDDEDYDIFQSFQAAQVVRLLAAAERARMEAEAVTARNAGNVVEEDAAASIASQDLREEQEDQDTGNEGGEGRGQRRRRRRRRSW